MTSLEIGEGGRGGGNMVCASAKGIVGTVLVKNTSAFSSRFIEDLVKAFMNLRTTNGSSELKYCVGLPE